MRGGVAVPLADVAVLFVQHGIVDMLELFGFVCLGVASRVVFPGNACETFGGTFFQEGIVPVFRACLAGGRRRVLTGRELLELVLQVWIDRGCVEWLWGMLQQGIRDGVMQPRIGWRIRHRGS